MTQYVGSRLLLLIGSFLLLAHIGLHAQSDRILPNPNAVQLQRIWWLEGEPSQDLGSWVADLGDITGDGLGDFALRDSDGLVGWNIFAGRAPAPDATPIGRCDSALYIYSTRPMGDGSTWILVWTLRHAGRWSSGGFVTQPLYELRLHRIVDGRPETVPTYREALTYPDTINSTSVQVADLDQDGADEIIVLGSVKGGATQILIYRGGPELRLDMPTLVLPRPESSYENILGMRIDNIDGDPYPDLLVLFEEGPGRIFWGEKDSLPDLSETGSRAIDSFPVPLDDVDGDGITDLIRSGADNTIMMFLSKRGKSARTRSFEDEDADIRLHMPTGTFSEGGQLRGDEFGSLVITNYHQAKRSDGSTYRVDDSLLILTGGPNGPDRSYDAVHVIDHLGTPTNLSVIRARPITDCNGDGWSDLLIGHSAFNFWAGAAYILAGGPYIPREDPSLGVHDLTLEGKPNALSLWPMPARDELNIAWRGDLARTPRRFIVTDLRGETVATGSVEAGVAAARWDCADVASGVYQLVVLDEQGERIASETVIKR